MKVIHILHELKFSGAEIMYVDAASLFISKGCELTVVATAKQLGEYAPHFESAGFQVLHMPYPDKKNYLFRIKFFISFINFLRQGKYNVVHIHSHRAMWGLSFCSWIAKVRCIYTFHSVFPTRPISFFYHCLLRLSAKFIFKCHFQSISDSVYNHELKLYKNNTTKIYNWYGSNRFYPASVSEKEKIREELQVPSNTFVVISVGGCSHVKRHTEIIKALPFILNELPNCIYFHLGQGDSLFEEIDLAKQLGVYENIRFYGNQIDVRKFLISADAYIMPSKFEGIPITTIEAMACQIPAILYNVPGLRDFNKEGENCIIIPEDYMLIYEKITSIKNNPELVKKLVVNAYGFINRNFNMQINVNKIYELYIS